MSYRSLGLAAWIFCAASQAQAIGNLADVALVDRHSGATLPTYFHQGEYWVAGRPGANYAISVRNKTGARILAVTSVDGVNVLSGETAGWDQSGYVFRPHHGYRITGWRKSSSSVAAFAFSAASDSYAGLTGRPDHVGVIGVALFRERQPEPIARAPELASPLPAPRAPSAGASGLAGRADGAPAPSRQADSAHESGARARSEAPVASRLGTAHGQREVSVVAQTRFERLRQQPDEVVRIRYDSRENLVAIGVIREPRVYPSVPPVNPFPGSDQASYVPDPPMRRH